MLMAEIIPQIMTKTDICRLYSLSPKTVNAYIEQRMLRPIPRPVGIKAMRYKREDVEKLFGRLYK